MNNHLMIDLETMGVEQDAAIVAIGAVLFDPHSSEPPSSKDQYYATISLESNSKAGRAIEGATVAWWLGQAEAARAEIATGSLMPLSRALSGFKAFVSAAKPSPTRVWAKDPDFDCTILRHAMEQDRLRWPFKFWESRSVRTAFELAYPDGKVPNLMPQDAIHHRAIDDAIHQAAQIILCYKKLR